MAGQLGEAIDTPLEVISNTITKIGFQIIMVPIQSYYIDRQYLPQPIRILEFLGFSPKSCLHSSWQIPRTSCSSPMLYHTLCLIIVHSNANSSHKIFISLFQIVCILIPISKWAHTLDYYMKQSISSQAPRVKLLILGEGGVGKTSLLAQFVQQQFKPTLMPTIGVKYKQKMVEVKGASLGHSRG